MFHLPVLAESQTAVRRFVLPVRAEAHGPATICTFSSRGENLRCGILPLPSADGNLPLHLLRHIPADDSLVGILHLEPFLFGIALPYSSFLGDVGSLIVYAAANAGLILQNTFDLGNRPDMDFSSGALT